MGTPRCARLLLLLLLQPLLSPPAGAAVITGVRARAPVRRGAPAGPGPGGSRRAGPRGPRARTLGGPGRP